MSSTRVAAAADHSGSSSSKRFKRVSWRSRHDLVELYMLIWDDWLNEEQRRKGLSRLSIYIASPSSPLFFPILHTLLSASLLPYPPPSPEMILSHRLTLAMSIVRFINGMIDPLQTSVYARPIALLARQLGIPPSLVGLRHQATHEDLPSLSVLRLAVEQCIEYLRTEAFWPLIADLAVVDAASGKGPAATDSGVQVAMADAKRRRRDKLTGKIDGLIKGYKKAIKAHYVQQAATTKKKGAASSSSKAAVGAGSSHEIRRIFRDLEDLIEVKTRQERDEQDADEDEGSESEMVMILVECLSRSGALVPNSKKKLPDAAQIASSLAAGAVDDAILALQLPTASEKIWGPLVRFLSAKLDAHLQGLMGSGGGDEDEDQDSDQDSATTFSGSIVMGCLKRVHQAALRRSTSQAASSARGRQADAPGLEFQQDFLRLSDEGPSGKTLPPKEPLDAENESYTWGLVSWALHLWRASLPASTTESSSEPEEDIAPRRQQQHGSNKRRRINKNQDVGSMIDGARASGAQHVMTRTERLEAIRLLLDYQMIESTSGVASLGSCSANAILRLLSHIDRDVADRGIAELNLAVTESEAGLDAAPPPALTLDEMERRLAELEGRTRIEQRGPQIKKSSDVVTTSRSSFAAPSSSSETLPLGWSRPDAATWTSKPIGVWS